MTDESPAFRRLSYDLRCCRSGNERLKILLKATRRALRQAQAELRRVNAELDRLKG